MMLENLGNDELLDLLSSNFGIDKATLRLEWERFEREAEQLAEENQKKELKEPLEPIPLVKAVSESIETKEAIELES
jgi:hypothetical protein